jgi:aspartate/methionine/tyrosine aminotransferase
MRNTPIDYQIVSEAIKNSGVPDIGQGSIREIVRLASTLEKATGKKFIRMEMGVPGINPPEIGTQAEIEALKRGVASKYPVLEGEPVLKNELARFAKLFLGLDEITSEFCVPSTGSMQGGMATFITAGRRDITKDTILFLDPGFPVQKLQCRAMGLKFENFDVYDSRGEKFREKLEEYFAKGNISCVLFSNPNNPTWICFTDDELRTIGDLATKYDVLVIEDLAYFAMDFRQDYSQPGKEPYQPSVTKYTKNYLILFSSSKAFSYAGQRIGAMIISPEFYNRRFPDLKRFYSSDQFGAALVYGSLYVLSSGVAHSPQYGFAAMLKAANDGTFNFIDQVKIYGERARVMKNMFLKYGFNIPYDHDDDLPLAHGFYFTLSYQGLTGSQLIEELLYYGISAISLQNTGSDKPEGIRACTSQTHENQFADLEYRLQRFHEDHPIK